MREEVGSSLRLIFDIFEQESNVDLTLKLLTLKLTMLAINKLDR